MIKFNDESKRKSFNDQTSGKIYENKNKKQRSTKKQS